MSQLHTSVCAIITPLGVDRKIFTTRKVHVSIRSDISFYCRSGNFRVIKFSCFKNFCVKIFSWSRIAMKIFWRFYVPRFSNLEWNFYAKEYEYEELACCVRSYHAAVGEPLACKREPNNAIGTYCGSKDRRFIGQWAKSCHTFAMSSSDMLVSKRLSRAK